MTDKASYMVKVRFSCCRIVWSQCKVSVIMGWRRSFLRGGLGRSIDNVILSFLSSDLDTRSSSQVVVSGSLCCRST